MKYLITGGTGTVGQALALRLLEDGNRVAIFSRNEDAQIRMKNEIQSDHLSFIPGDVRDYQECLDATKVDVIYHLAAMKHLGICEQQPQESVKTNTVGTMNMINAAKYNKVKRFIHLSTDKVVYPSSVYGVTKLAAEKLVVSANGGKTIFSVIRSGNILGSSNSILPILMKQVKEGKITITDGRMTRFFIPLPELIDWLINDDISIATKLKWSSVFIPKMSSFQLMNLAVSVRGKYNPSAIIQETQAGAKEKFNETLFTEEERQYVLKTDDGWWIENKVQYNCDTKCPHSCNYLTEMKELI